MICSVLVILVTKFWHFPRNSAPFYEQLCRVKYDAVERGDDVEIKECI